MEPLPVYVTPLMPRIRRWLIPLTTLLALGSVSVSGKSVLWENACAVVNALIVADYFKDRMNGETACYLLAQVDPDNDDAVLADCVMVFAAAMSVLIPIWLIASRVF